MMLQASLSFVSTGMKLIGSAIQGAFHFGLKPRSDPNLADPYMSPIQWQPTACSQNKLTNPMHC